MIVTSAVNTVMFNTIVLKNKRIFENHLGVVLKIKNIDIEFNLLHQVLPLKSLLPKPIKANFNKSTIYLQNCWIVLKHLRNEIKHSKRLFPRLKPWKSNMMETLRKLSVKKNRLSILSSVISHKMIFYSPMNNSPNYILTKIFYYPKNYA